VRRVRYPGHHHLRRVRIGEAILLREAVEWVGVVGGPDLVGVFENAEIDASAAAGARLDFDLRVALLEFGKNVIEVARKRDIDFLLLGGCKLIPPWLAPVAVVVPFEEGDIVFVEQLVEEAQGRNRGRLAARD
jgi:hypothetical protein